MADICVNTNNNPERTEVEDCSPSGILCFDLTAAVAIFSLIKYYFWG